MARARADIHPPPRGFDKKIIAKRSDARALPSAFPHSGMTRVHRSRRAGAVLMSVASSARIRAVAQIAPSITRSTRSFGQAPASWRATKTAVLEAAAASESRGERIVLRAISKRSRRKSHPPT